MKSVVVSPDVIKQFVDVFCPGLAGFVGNLGPYLFGVQLSLVLGSSWIKISRCLFTCGVRSNSSVHAKKKARPGHRMLLPSSCNCLALSREGGNGPLYPKP